MRTFEIVSIGHAKDVGCDVEHVLIYGWLGRLVNYLKGGYKNSGRSPVSDLLGRRSEVFWRWPG